MLQLQETLCLANLDQNMVRVEGGTFDMGGESSWASAKPIHTVRLDNFEICRYPVSQQLWYEVMGENPEELKFENRNRPAERVSWEDINNQFLPALRENTGGNSYCLPTEAQWEYAARGGKWRTKRRAEKVLSFAFAGSNNLKEVGWYDENSYSETNPLACKRPNSLSLYGMSGNVWEWCQDWYSDTYYGECQEKGVALNPEGPSTGTSRVARGGSWYYNSLNCRVSDRNDVNPLNRDFVFGFRLCRYSPR